MTKLIVSSLIFCITLACPLCSYIDAQTSPAAPIPSQILTAKKIFIANASDEFETGYWSGDANRTYNEFYAAIKNQTQYQLVSSPSEADLILQIRLLVYPVGETNFKLALIDPKTQTLLWQMSASVSLSGLKNSRDKNFSAAMSNLVNNFKSLTSQSALSSK
jgi:hypothetical protein